MKISPHALLVLATLFWAGNFVVGRPLTEALPPFGINLVRWAVACAILVPLTMAREGRIRRPPRAAWPALAGMAFTGVFLFNALVYRALGETTSVSASLVMATAPIATLLLAAVAGAGHLTGRGFVGTLLGLLGVAWIVSGGSPEALLGLSVNRGDVVMLAAVLLWACYTLLAQKAAREVSPLAATTIAALLSLPLSAVFGGYQLAVGPVGEVSPAVVAGLLYVGSFASVASFLAWNAGIRRLGADRGAIFLNLIPVFTAAIAVSLLGEGLGAAQLIGGLLVLAGVALTTRGGPRGNRRPEPRSVPGDAAPGEESGAACGRPERRTA